MTDIKSCPFCGNSEYNEVCHPAPNFATWMVMCGACSSTGSERDTIEDAIEAWNRRAEDKMQAVNYIFPKGRFIEYLSQKLGILEGEAEELICEFDRRVEE